jgi:hypothetical protein
MRTLKHKKPNSTKSKNKQNKTNKKRNPATKSVLGSKKQKGQELVINDGIFNIKYTGDKYRILDKNNNLILLVYPILIANPDISSYIDTKKPKLNKVLFPELQNKTSTHKIDHIKFIVADKENTQLYDQNPKNKINLEPAEQKSCHDNYFMTNECLDISVDFDHKKKLAWYFINSLLQSARIDSLAHRVPGKYYILIAEDYITRTYSTDGKYQIRGGLNDMAHFYKLDICDKLNEYLQDKYITPEILAYFVKQVNGNSPRFATLSAMTMFKTGFSFYEKMGYMYVPDEKGLIKPSTPYIQVFDLFLDGLLERLRIILMPIAEFIKTQKHNQKQDKSDKFLLAKFNESLRLVKLVLHELAPKQKFAIKTLHDLYKIIDTSWYSFDYFMKDDNPNSSGEKQNNRRVLYYSIMRSEIMFILSLIISKLMPDFGVNCHKFRVLQPSPVNIFTLEQHRLLPGIYPAYLGQLISPGQQAIFKGKQYDNIRGKMTKVLDHLKLLSV